MRTSTSSAKKILETLHKIRPSYDVPVSKIFSSPELTYCLLSICPSVCVYLSVYFYLIFNLQQHWVISTKCSTTNPWLMGIKLYSRDVPCLLGIKGRNRLFSKERCMYKQYSKLLKIFFQLDFGSGKAEFTLPAESIARLSHGLFDEKHETPVKMFKVSKDSGFTFSTPAEKQDVSKDTHLLPKMVIILVLLNRNISVAFGCSSATSKQKGVINSQT